MLKKNDKLAGTQKFGAEYSQDFLTGSRMVAEDASQNRLITTQDQARENLRRKSVVSPDI
jgi:hypothetical protein